jgi:formate hydrogenlyase subunit 6/NADH:ubiquinone oxidoreductase subunit I
MRETIADICFGSRHAERHCGQRAKVELRGPVKKSPRFGQRVHRRITNGELKMTDAQYTPYDADALRAPVMNCLICAACSIVCPTALVMIQACG